MSKEVEVSQSEEELLDQLNQWVDNTHDRQILEDKNVTFQEIKEVVENWIEKQEGE